MLSKARQVADKYFTRYKPSVFDSGPPSKLPEAYKKFWREWRETTPQPVHYVPVVDTWIKTKLGEMKRIENVPLPGRHTAEMDKIITGGEMIIQGFKKKTKTSPRNPHFWVPEARKSVIYSEVLNKHISVLITLRAIELIMKHGGFDFYVLQTKACDLRSLLPLKLKRKILLALRDMDLPYDEEKNRVIYDKYKEFLLPHEEIEWYGLTLTEAVKKLESIEKEKPIVPLKHMYRRQAIAILKQGK